MRDDARARSSTRIHRRPPLVVALALMVGLLVVPLVTGAQQRTTVPLIGILHVSSMSATAQNIAAFQEALRELGYSHGQNIVVDRRSADGKAERLPELAAELVSRKPTVIVAATDLAIAAVKKHTRTIPIVMANSVDPVSTGFVMSLAHPGGNITGLSLMAPEMSAKRLELLREVLPRLSRVALMWNPDVRGAVLDYKEAESAARALRLQLQSIEVSSVEDFDRGFAAITEGRADALIVAPLNPPTFTNRAQLVALAQKHRLPSMYGLREFADAGGLMSYGPSLSEGWRRAATYVDKILKGAKPGDLPVEQPNKFELVINLKTAKALGLTIPPSLLQRADHVIR